MDNITTLMVSNVKDSIKELIKTEIKSELIQAFRSSLNIIIFSVVSYMAGRWIFERLRYLRLKAQQSAFEADDQRNRIADAPPKVR